MNKLLPTWRVPQRRQGMDFPAKLPWVHPKSSVIIGYLNPRTRSLVRGNLLVLLSLMAAFFLSDFPRDRPTLWLALPSVLAIVGTVDTVRCMQPKWSFYHGGVLLCVYMDLMAVSMILFFFLYPYMSWLISSR
ncbi:permease [Granulicella arctica]|uniref:permease n=1 Tax=Granulicella arctica TaxID=940613 RepID=UPI0021DFA2A0|nr:permease [Granulicella arctica]